ncbi:aromatic amino acid transport family protein [Francisella adeliensis]|uniref:Amino acid transporter n=1 Tax=Francisella adeliensis TaxID=2007306 RepID=A0A2Z4XZH7_9GAMM|nr:aromatic amino acid transport family protein [Francisella adeliensis]AXA34271.1 hypothetical protein CDH04_07570 [Francisella adeliensis]MBK2084912.1 hypothetical protein [Francisella adeliensis]MBK2096257.1 hypothetical protein [Francisella adeliensis]QIW12515.1 hypothetical protein FZC43_07575 [Francisella adeliensis]QIW14388.1 hypothetical protein FZC44_07570 [Francisella adeliensis]
MSSNVGFFKYCGCVLLVISSMIGGGIFALPIMAFKVGIIATIVLTISMYILMTISGMLVVEVSTKLPKFRNHYTSLAQEAFGMPGKIITLIAFSVAIYASLTAYIGAVPSLLGSNACNINLYSCISPSIAEVLFTAILSIVLIGSMKYSEKINRVVMTVKLISLVLVILLLSRYIDLKSLFVVPMNFTAITQATLIVILAFSYQSILPSIVNYVGPENKKEIKKIILIGTFITCVIYTLWVVIMSGFIKHAGADEIFMADPTLDGLVSIIKQSSSSSLAVSALDIFLNVSLFASFITISLAFIDFWIDALKLSPNLKGRIIAGAIVLIPSLLIAVYFNDIFVLALAVSGFAGIAYSIVLPASVSCKLFDKYNRDGSYFFGGGRGVRALIFIIAVIFMIFALFY